MFQINIDIVAIANQSTQGALTATSLLASDVILLIVHFFSHATWHYSLLYFHNNGLMTLLVTIIVICFGKCKCLKTMAQKCKCTKHTKFIIITLPTYYHLRNTFSFSFRRLNDCMLTELPLHSQTRNL